MAQPQLKRLRYGGTCAVCGAAIERGAEGWHDAENSKIGCAEHGEAELARVTGTGTRRPVSQPAQSARPKAPSEPAIPKQIKVSRAGRCAACNTELPVKSEAYWVEGTRVLVCPACTAAEIAVGLGANVPGASASKVADAAARKQAERLLAAYPSHTLHAWTRGADGERIVGRQLDIAAQEGKVVVLHDRRLASGGNIDHLVIGQRRITVIDAKHYRGALIGKREEKGVPVLTIDGHDADHLIDGVRAQRNSVQDALHDEPLLADNTAAALAFVEARFGFAGLLTVRGVWCSPVKDAVGYAAMRVPTIGRHGINLDEAERQRVADKLAKAFPPYR